MKKSHKKWMVYLIIGIFLCWLWFCTDVFRFFKDPIVVFFS